jgi:methylmalonyl-CoA mutase C-terminal domain/subunit
MKNKIRVLLAKPGLDGHDRGMGVIASTFRDAGMEVIYLGIHLSCEEIVRAALEEDADVIALSVLSAAHLPLFKRVSELMKKERMDRVLLLAGGIIPPEDEDKLRSFGVGAIFGPGTETGEAVKFIADWHRRSRC